MGHTFLCGLTRVAAPYAGTWGRTFGCGRYHITQPVRRADLKVGPYEKPGESRTPPGKGLKALVSTG